MSTIVKIYLKPGSKKESIRENEFDGFDIAISSRPIDGKANNHLIKFLSKKLGVTKSSIHIIRGTHSRKKTVSIEGLNNITLLEKLTKISKQY